MAKRGVGNTALGAAVCRLIEQYQPEQKRLFDDPLVKDLVSGPVRVLMQMAAMRSFTIRQTDAITPGIFGAQVCRARYIDDAVQTIVENGVDQLVILGAGLDTRPYRLPRIERVRVFEVDLPDAQDEKKKNLIKRLGKLPTLVTYLPVDFDTQTLDTVFSGTGYDSARPAVFIWEGVTQYLSEEQVRQTLAFVGKSAPGSVILFTYVLRSIIDGSSKIPGADKMLQRMEKNNSNWAFGLEPGQVAEFLRPYHLGLIADVGRADYQRMYLRPLRRDLVVSDIERVVEARVF
jgi:methyltransferase (TIGR00027 family)